MFKADVSIKLVQFGPKKAMAMSPVDSSSSGNSTVSTMVSFMAGGWGESIQGLCGGQKTGISNSING